MSANQQNEEDGEPNPVKGFSHETGDGRPQFEGNSKAWHATTPNGRRSAFRLSTGQRNWEDERTLGEDFSYENQDLYAPLQTVSLSDLVQSQRCAEDNDTTEESQRLRNEVTELRADPQTLVLTEKMDPQLKSI